MKHRELSLKPDYDRSAERFEAFWNFDVADRPPVNIAFPRKNYAYPNIEPKTYSSFREKWLDVDYRAARDAAWVSSLEYYADSMPMVWPNMGPEIFSVWCGCDYDFTESTTWAKPLIKNWESDFGKAKLNMDSDMFRLVDRYTDLLIEYGKGNFIVGLTDLHPGGDHVAALRDPENLAADLILEPRYVKKMLEVAKNDYYRAYSYFADKIIAAGMPVTSWTPLFADGYYYIPSNDFSCMISEKMFEEFFLDGIADECRFYEHSIYHLDGPGALRHLDNLLAIKDLDALQWVPGAGRDNFPEVISIYQRAQKAKKGIQLWCHVNQLDTVFENLKPNGVWFAGLGGISNKEEADYALVRIAAWK